MPSGMGAVRWIRFNEEKLIFIQLSGNIIAFQNVHLTGELDYLALMPGISTVAPKTRSKFWDLLM
jgi:hypothetical protein